jgi:hypothetical protein
MAAPTNAAKVKILLANPDPSTHGPIGEVLARILEVRLLLRSGRDLLTSSSSHFQRRHSDLAQSAITRHRCCVQWIFGAPDESVSYVRSPMGEPRVCLSHFERTCGLGQALRAVRILGAWSESKDSVAAQ